MSRRLNRPNGLIRQGSGRTDPNSRHGLPVDDVPAVLGRGEYVVNQKATEAVGVDFLNNINNIGLGNSTLPRGTGRYGNYQNGGQVGGGMNNPITQANLNASAGQFVYQHNGQPYTGPYHVHQDGTHMIGAGKMGVNHEIKPNEVIIRSSNGRNNMRGRGRRKQPVTNRRSMRSSYQKGGRVRNRKFQEGGHTIDPSAFNTAHSHEVPAHSHEVSPHHHIMKVDRYGRLAPGSGNNSINVPIPDHFDPYAHNYGYESPTSVSIGGGGNHYLANQMNPNHPHGGWQYDPTSDFTYAQNSSPSNTGLAGRHGGHNSQNGGRRGTTSRRNNPRPRPQMRNGNKVGTLPNGVVNGNTMAYQNGGSVSMGMCIEGTNQRYNGMTLEVGGAHYSTKGGTLEGNSRKLKPCN